jgi:hypothetical protein
LPPCCWQWRLSPGLLPCSGPGSLCSPVLAAVARCPLPSRPTPPRQPRRSRRSTSICPLTRQSGLARYRRHPRPRLSSCPRTIATGRRLTRRTRATRPARPQATRPARPHRRPRLTHPARSRLTRPARPHRRLPRPAAFHPARLADLLGKYPDLPGASCDGLDPELWFTPSAGLTGRASGPANDEVTLSALPEGRHWPAHF